MITICPIPESYWLLEGQLLAAINTELEQGRAVYVHCWGGIGRTGTVAACWLVEQGLSADDALVRVQLLRWGKHEQWLRSPETDEQCDFVRAWAEEMMR